MNPIERLSARFIDDLLRLLSGASIEELMALAATAGAASRKGRPLFPPPAVRPKAAPAEARRHAATRVARAVDAAVPPRRPTLEEITDPEKLLAITSSAPAPAPRTPRAARIPKVSTSRLIAEVPAEPPSAVRAIAPRLLVQLKGNETVARASSSGIVIRRRKSI
jgi:hypothetical protein